MPKEKRVEYKNEKTDTPSYTHERGLAERPVKMICREEAT